MDYAHESLVSPESSRFGDPCEALARAVERYHRAQVADAEVPPPADAPARWKLLEHFESDGRRYVLACRGEAARTGLAALTPREHEALALLASGYTNKVVAYEMGVAHSTAAVLLHRARRKLGASTRAELIRAFLAQGGQPTQAA